MFDRSLLRTADWAFVLLADTHLMLAADTVEFDSRRHQTARTEHAIQLVNALDPAFVVHLGDLVQAFPGSNEFERAMDAAEGQLGRLASDLHLVPGNHDVGDKPDPTMPTAPASASSIAGYHERFGRSWAHWQAGEIDFVAINSQLLNSTLEVAAEQRTWVETTLRDEVDGPTFLFSHLPPFLADPDDPGLGHYDTIGEPARGWLLDLVRATPVTHVFSAHTHFQLRNRLGDTEFHVLPSPAFTRPGFAEAFSSGPPPERGRDDRPKLGFYLVRVREGEPTFHFIRTGGRTALEWDAPTRALLTRPTGAVPASRLGVSLLQPLVPTAVVPAVFPASVQYPIHDDYPLLGCFELGATYLRLPVDTGQPSARTRSHLEQFRARGGTVIGTHLWSVDGSTEGPSLDGPAGDTGSLGPVDEVELRLGGAIWPTEGMGETLAAVRATTSRPVGLSVTLPGRTVPGKQHDRPRIGYRLDELESLDDRLAELGVSVDRVVCRVGQADDPWDAIRDAPTSFTHIEAVDWLLSSVDHDLPTSVDRVCLALLAVATRPASRLYLEPLRALDRTMDVAPGLLDRQRNPTAAFHAARTLNTALFGPTGAWRPRDDRRLPAGRLLGATAEDRFIVLALPDGAGEPFAIDLPAGLPTARARRIDLQRGLITPVAEATDHVVGRPTIFAFE